MTRAAAIDVGTNSVRLLVADRTSEGLIEVERDLVMTRMGEGVDASRKLADAALDRTVRAIRDYHRRSTGAGAELVRIAATSAVRDSSDRKRFVDAVHEAIGLAPEILTGEQEAHLSFLGAVTGLEAEGPFLVLDVGGGSTEFVRGSRDVEAWTSMDIGSVRLTERHIKSDPPRTAELDALTADADRAIQEAKASVGEGAATLIGLAGTITTLAAVSLGLDRYDRARIHHAVLSARELRRLAEMLATMTNEERSTLPVMPPGREDVIVAGAFVTVRVMEVFGYDEVLVSEADLLDGLILSSGPEPASR